MRRIALALLSAAALAACASAQKTADKAAAAGDWKTAEANYAVVLKDDPGNAEKRARWQDARARALQGAVDRGAACRAAQDWECAFGEADYLARMEPGSPEYAALRAEAGRQAGWRRLGLASQALSAGDWRGAFAGLAAARAASSDAALQAEASRLQPAIVSGAVAEAQRLRAQQQYPLALELLSSAAAVDAGVRPTLDATRAEYDRWLTAHYEQEAQQGDALLREHRFAEAARAYDAAQRFRAGGRAEPLARYARALEAGEAGVRQRDWRAATRAYEEALATGMDGQGGYARTQLDRVEIRGYEIRLRSVALRGARRDGAHRGEPGRERRPNLVAILRLPDGRHFETQPQRAFEARLDATVVFATNRLDERPVSIRIVDRDERGDLELGTVRLRVADLLAGGELGLSDGAVADLRLVADRTPFSDGTAMGFAPVSAGSHPHPPAR